MAPAATPTPGFVQLARIILHTARDNRLDLVEELSKFSPVPCTTKVQGAGGPPACRAGEADGTPVNVMFGSSCEGYYVRQNELSFERFSLVTTDGAPIYGMYRTASSNVATAWPQARYAVVLKQAMPDGRVNALALFTDEQAIVGFMQACGETPEYFVQKQKLTDVLSEPETRE
jgi:hypothetical protein